jgi:hypothetical protein
VSAAVIALAGCAHTEVVWEKAGASQQDLAQDSDGCRAQAQAGQVSVGSAAQQTGIVYSSCMEKKGWKRVEAPKP